MGRKKKSPAKRRAPKRRTESQRLAALWRKLKKMSRESAAFTREALRHEEREKRGFDETV